MKTYTIQHEVDQSLTDEVLNRELSFVRLIVTAIHSVGGRVVAISILHNYMITELAIKVITTIDYEAPEPVMPL